MQFSGLSTDIAHDSDKQKCANETLSATRESHIQMVDTKPLNYIVTYTSIPQLLHKNTRLVICQALYNTHIKQLECWIVLDMSVLKIQGPSSSQEL